MGQFLIARSEKGMCCTLRSSSPSTSNTMNVIFRTTRTRRHVIVDNRAHIFHVQTTCCNVCGNQQTKCPRLEGIDNLGSFPLLSVSVKRITGKSLIPKPVCQIISHIFPSDKYNHFSMFFPTKVSRLLTKPVASSGWFRFFRIFLRSTDEIRQNFFQLVGLFIFLAHVNNLSNVLVGIEHINLANIDLDRISQEVKSKPLNLFGPRRRKKQRLPLGGVWDTTHDGSDLRFKTHVEHSICFIQHHKSDA
mmetsp:Transcript_29249/g.53955  ORF Transcript_29249/g.53955 Transcript_29249/m.53955 type:complete len:248 (-) Transcript_29249:953-1696(-)